MEQQQDAFGRWLNRQLRRTGMSQAQLAERLDVTRAAVSAWINNRATPRDDKWRAIAEIFGADVEVASDRRSDSLTKASLQWQYRPAHADGGREYGNAAAFAFKADLSVLAREATQNSLDERHDPDHPVHVHYVLHELTGEHLTAFLRALQWDTLRDHYEAAAVSDQKVARSLRAALADLEATKSLLLLRIDDYNASGLTGPEYGDGRYAAVVRRQLDSHKEARSRAGGSYGLGKVTLWATSRLNLVLVNSTLSEPYEGRTERRVVGRLDLPWHEVDGKAYAGPAWFGEPDDAPGRADASRSWWADEATVRDLHLDRTGSEPGTSFLVVGAHDASGDAQDLQEMHEKLVRSLADGFWAAMVAGRNARPHLEARVTTMRNGHVLISEQRVDPHEHRPALSRAFQAYLDGETVPELTSGDQVAEVNVPLLVSPRRDERRKADKGVEHQAVLLLTPAGDQDKKINQIVLMRGNRMTVREYPPRELPLGAMPFQAVLLAGYATGKDTADVEAAEQFLRASEPPEHDRWGRTEELTSTYVRGALSRVQEFLREIDNAVRELVGRRETRRSDGPSVLRDLLRLDSPVGGRRAQGVPTVRNIVADVESSGAWRVRVDIKLPAAEDPWLLTPVAKFDVRSGGRPTIEWGDLIPGEGCRRQNWNLVVPPGVRSASFTGITNPASHPVDARFARLVVDVQKTRGGAA